MHVGKRFSFLGYFSWVKKELLYFFVIATLPVIIHSLFHWTPHFKFPYYITALLGMSVAFVIALKNSEAVTRLREASLAYCRIQSVAGGIGLRLREAKIDSEDKLIIVNFLLAWLTALRYQLRQRKIWENLDDSGNKEFMRATYVIPEERVSIEVAMREFVPKDELAIFLESDRSAHCFLEKLVVFLDKSRSEEKIDDPFFAFMLDAVAKLNEMQFQCLNIKNTPYPRNFFSITQYFLIIFLIGLPFSVYSELPQGIAPWAYIPISFVIAWIFICLEKVGQNTLNLFEGGVNDVPITSISRDIEISLKKSIGVTELPERLEPMSGFVLL